MSCSEGVKVLTVGPAVKVEITSDIDNRGALFRGPHTPIARPAQQALRRIERGLQGHQPLKVINRCMRGLQGAMRPNHDANNECGVKDWPKPAETHAGVPDTQPPVNRVHSATGSRGQGHRSTKCGFGKESKAGAGSKTASAHALVSYSSAAASSGLCSPVRGERLRPLCPFAVTLGAASCCVAATVAW